MAYADHFKTLETAQNEPIPGSAQVPNSGGGFAWSVDDWTRLDRFLILGNEGGSYYASEKTMTLANAGAVMRCLSSDGPRAVARILEISEAGRAPKNDPAIFALALAAGKGDAATKRLAFDALPRVCRIGTHLFQFLEAVQGFRGWGRGLRHAVGRWYTGKDSDRLAYQLVKYRQRGGWTHRDALRLSKPKAGTRPEFQWAVGKESEALPAIIQAFIAVEKAASAKDVVRILGECPMLPWEAIPSEHLTKPEVWEAILPNLPMTALIRNLARMTANGLIAPLSSASKIVMERLNDAGRIKEARVHPVAVLGALCTYKQGHGVKGSLSWNPVSQVLDALDCAFYLAFGNVIPANKRTLFALDVSGSMECGNIASMPGLTPRVGSAAMAMVLARTEPNWGIVGFTATGRGHGGQWGGDPSGLTPISISPKQRLDDVCREVAKLPMGGTDCALPMVWALQKNIQIDTFIVFTDSETWHGEIHPSQALLRYRQKTGINAKLVVVGMVANEFTIADPADAGMMDVVGFDTAAPSIINDFSRS
jgi:60 kDa SS-A/Ro ribonucleoprotein